MRRRTKITIAVSAVIVVLGAIAAIAGPVIYRDFIAEPAAEAPTLTADESTLDPGTGADVDADGFSGSWVVAEGSEAGYRVDEVLNGTDVTVTGRTTEVSGDLEVDGLTLTEAVLSVDVASISTDSGSRDDYFRDQALRTDTHPTASFALTEAVTADEAPTAGSTFEYELTGDLTLAGETRAVTFTAQARTDGTTAEVVGQVPIVFADFGVAAPDLGFVSVEPDGYVEFDLVLTRE
ncbi:YceI family protein [Leucobacter weissii]|uniref:YceI family protein n=1 Tax=Leucobacter weissii TaxID=1983706 RepID=A0A939MGW3_9MICO|nr:YceI family protein [Leucobacter weissii]MBO1900678.1 YceI family protein [Leucobacter weissii]